VPFRVIAAVARKDLQVAFTQRLLIALGVIVPVNFLLLFMLFALNGGQAPTAVVLDDHGPLAQQFVAEMRGARSFQVTEMTWAQAQNAIAQGRIVAIVRLPADFDSRLGAGETVVIPVTVNNLQTDFTNDIRRAVPMTVTRFDADAFPGQISVKAQEIDLYRHDTDYIPYLAVSVAVLGMLLAGILQGATSAAKEHESSTVIELALSPAPKWAIVTGKLLAVLALNAISGGIVLAIVVALEGGLPSRPFEVLGVALLLMIAFAGLGVLVGNVVRRRQAAIPLSLAISLPLFFISGPFGPINWLGSVPALLARISPAYYGIGAFQDAFHGYVTSQTGLTGDVFALGLLAVATVLLGARTLRPRGAGA
jgi:ABC-type transport system involved in multi-copper enzyme maturation permease subunit